MNREAFLEALMAYSVRTDAALKGYLAREGVPALLQESMAYSLFAGGKRLRPAMTLAAAEMLSGESDGALPAACALEMIHTYSLIHDDLPAMDDDELRRGKPTNHVVYGEGNAILAGDGLLSLAMELLMEACVRDPRYARAALAIAQGAGVSGMVAGQSRDLLAEKKGDRAEATLLAIHRGKTAAMLIASVEAGGYCAGAGEADLVALTRFGEQYGLLFQITDDILDVEGDAAVLGKSIGKDAAHGKLTYPAVYGLAGAKKRAEAARAAAADAIAGFGERAAFFYGLLDFTMARRS